MLLNLQLHIGLFLKGVKTTQGSSYVTKNRVCLLVAYYRLISRIGRVAKLQVNMVW